MALRRQHILNLECRQQSVQNSNSKSTKMHINRPPLKQNFFARLVAHPNQFDEPELAAGAGAARATSTAAGARCTLQELGQVGQLEVDIG